MKKTIIFLLANACCIISYAQNDNMRRLKNYPNNTKVQTTNTHCIISGVSLLDSFAINKDAKSIWHLVNIADTNKVLLFEFSPDNRADLAAQYDTLENNKYAGLPLLEQLVNRAKDKNGEIKFINDKVADQANMDEQNETTIANNENDLQSKTTKNDNSIWWILASIASLLGGLALGYFVAKRNDNTTQQKNDNAFDSKEATQQIVTLQNTNQGLLQQLQMIQTQLQTLKDDDAAYFNNAIKLYVNPVKKALNKQQSKETLEYAMQILVQYIAIADYKTDRREGSDDFNIALVKNGGDAAAEFSKTQKGINGNTNADAVPNDLKTILQILKDNSIDVPHNLAYMGYRFSN